MEQSVGYSRGEMVRAVRDLKDFVARSVGAAKIVETPFYHLELANVFPDDLYSRLLDLKPDAADYRPMHGRSKSKNADAPPTRVKIDLFPEYIRHLRPGQAGPVDRSWGRRFVRTR